VEVPTPSLTYWKLFRKLFNTEYVWLVSGDDNRGEDGLELREEFFVESNLEDDDSLSMIGCSIFEMLIAFSRRAEFNAGETPEFWFWKFLENLELHEENDASTTPPEKIDRILYDFVWRDYDEDGYGGLFPMNDPPEDQRKVEVFYQFCQYLVDQDWPI
jgi:hypothetical protein